MADSLKARRGMVTRLFSLTVAVLLTTACGLAGFGGSLQLNITDRQTHELTITVDGGSPNARLFEVQANGEIELGTGSATITRYVLQRTTFGRGVSTGYFLCPKPCTDPLNTYLVAYSPDQLFRPDGQLELRFRVLSEDGSSEDLARTVNAEMLPALWDSPTIEIMSGRR